jgi:predicted TIM-barrel fold metal-dependent hydrolase
MTLIVDADAHVCEARDLFTERLPSKYGDAIPHVKYRPEVSQDWWFVGDTPIEKAVGSVMVSGEHGEVRRADQMSISGSIYDEQHPSSYDPNERVKVMDAYGIRAATTYPFLGLTGPDVWKATEMSASLEFQVEVVKAYNDWILTWATEQPGRFIPLGCLPYWNIEAAVAEIERCAEIGIKGMVMSGWPQNHGCPIFPDPQWDPLWAAAQAANFSLSFHAGGGGNDDTARDSNRKRLLGQAQLTAWATTVEFLKNALSGVDIVMSGVLNRFPKLKFALIETGAGWAPFVLDAMDVHYLRYRPWETNETFTREETPSFLFRRQVFVTNWFEQLVEGVPFENTMFETDYPHPTSLIGDEIQNAIRENMTVLTSEQREDVLWRNALRCFNVTPAEVGITDEMIGALKAR